MAAQLLSLPTIQNWSCHSCSACCRQHLIEVTEEERQRILEQGWTEQDGIPSDRPVLVKHAGPPWKKRYRLGQQADGACIFLDEQGLCRIHAKFGENAKPLPCKIYPYAFHPAGRKVAVSLRYSCPSVVANRGRAVSEQTKDLKPLAGAVVPEWVSRIPPPKISAAARVDWDDFMRFIDTLDAIIAEENVPIVRKLLSALSWIGLIEQSQFGRIVGSRLDEFLQIIKEAASAEIPERLEEIGEPSRVGRMQFRMLVAQYARKDTLVDLESGLWGRWRLFRAAIRFARGTGNVPLLQDVFRQVPFSAMEEPFGGITAEAEEIFSRYFRVKIQGVHFCGLAYYGIPLVEGFRSLALIYPSILWLARWLAAARDQSTLETDDIARALSIADHYHAYAPSFGSRNFRRRVRLLAHAGDIAKLCTWYNR
jgi:lysine-N-methylase